MQSTFVVLLVLDHSVKALLPCQECMVSAGTLEPQEDGFPISGATLCILPWRVDTACHSALAR